MGETEMMMLEGIIPLFDRRPERPTLPKPRSRSESEKENLEKLCRALAGVALQFLKEKQGLHYEFHSTMGSSSFLYARTRNAIVHGNFKATKVGSDSGDPQIFFAEAKYKKDFFGLEVLGCSIIEPSEMDDQTKYSRGCAYCFSHVSHVVHHPIGNHSVGTAEDLKEMMESDSDSYYTESDSE